MKRTVRTALLSPTSRRVLLTAFLAVAALSATTPASACRCGPGPDSGEDGERVRLASGGKAFIGRVVSKRPVDRGPHRRAIFNYRIRIGRSFNVRLGRTLELTPSQAVDCRFQWRIGERVAAYLSGRRGDWSTSLCELADPDDLIRDSKPYPRPARRGRVAALAYGPFSGATLMALDGRGRILGYGFGGGASGSVCPGSGLVVETGSGGRGRAYIYTRRISDLRVIGMRRAPENVAEVRCLDPSGSRLVVFAGGGDFDTAGRYRLLRMRGRTWRQLRRGTASLAAFSQRRAYTLEGVYGERLVVTDLRTGRSQRLAKLARGWSLSPSPDGRRLALISVGRVRKSQLVVVDLSGRSPQIRRRTVVLPGGGADPNGDLLWQDADELVFVPFSQRPRPLLRYDSRLRPLGRFGRWSEGHAVIGGGRLLGVLDDRFRSFHLGAGRGVRTGRLPTESTESLLAVPGEPTAAIGPRKPRPRRPVVRRACSA